MTLNKSSRPLALAVCSRLACFGWACFGSAFSGTAWAQIPAIQLSALSRAAGQAPSSFPIRIGEGEQTDEVDQLVFTHPGITATLETSPARLLETAPQPLFAQFGVSIAPEVDAGIYEVRLRGRFGLSNPRAFLVTKSPVQFMEQEHTAQESATELALQTVIVDRTYPQKRNFYRVALAEKQRFHVCAHARRLDSRAIVALALLDPQGKQVARARAMGEFPAEFTYQATQPGTYTLLAYDFLYQGGASFAYALQAIVDPESVTTPPETELKRLGATDLQTIGAMNQQATQGRLKPAAADPAAVHSRWITPEAITAAAQSNAAASSERCIPFTHQGQFPDQAPSVLFDFKAAAGQVLWIEVISAGLDQLTDPRAIVYKVNRDAAGTESLQQLAEQDDAATVGGAAMKVRLRDPYFSFTAPENATYRLLLADNETGSRPPNSRNFVVTVREPQPAFELLAYQPFPSKDPAQSKNWGSNLMRGGTEWIHVLAIRRDGFSDAIELSAEGLPAGITSDRAIVPAGSNDATLVVRAADDAPDWQGALRIVGRSSGAVPLERTAMTGTTLRGATPTRNAIEARLAANLMLRANALDTAPLLVTVGEGQTLEMARGGKLPLPVKVTRRPGGAGKCTLRPQNLPPKTTLAEVAVEPDKSEGTAELVIAPDATPGEYTFWMLNETPIKWRPNPQALTSGEAYAAVLKAASEDPAQAAEKPKLDEALKAALERVEQLKKSTAERDLTVYFPTPQVRVRIVDSPIRAAPLAALTGPAGAEHTVEINIERLFGFADTVELSPADKPPIEGLQLANAQIPADSNTVKLILKVPANAAATTVSIPIKLDCKFNGHALSQTLSLPLTVASQ